LINIDTEGDVESAVNMAIQSFKEREVAMEASLNDTEYIGKTVSPFERIYVPRINGETPVDFETVANPSSSIGPEDLKTLNKDIISGMPVPSSLLDSSDATYHTTLAQESMAYAVTVMNIQRIITQGDQEQASKVHQVIKGKALDKIYTYKLNPPSALLNEARDNSVQNVRSVVDFVYEMYVDDTVDVKTTHMKKSNIAKELAPELNWEVFDKIFSEDSISFNNEEKNLKKNDDNEGVY